MATLRPYSYIPSNYNLLNCFFIYLLLVIILLITQSRHYIVNFYLIIKFEGTIIPSSNPLAPSARKRYMFGNISYDQDKKSY
jgi:hypothetical protein